MRHTGPSLSLAGVLGLAGLLTPVPSTLADPQVRPSVAARYGKLPLAFEVNRGQQADPAVQFLARGPGYTLLLTPTAMLLSVHAPQRLPGGDVDVRPDSPPLPFA